MSEIGCLRGDISEIGSGTSHLVRSISDVQGWTIMSNCTSAPSKHQDNWWDSIMDTFPLCQGNTSKSKSVPKNRAKTCLIKSTNTVIARYPRGSVCINCLPWQLSINKNYCLDWWNPLICLYLSVGCLVHLITSPKERIKLWGEGSIDSYHYIQCCHEDINCMGRNN